MKTMTGATIAALAFSLGLASTPAFAADYAQYRPDRDRSQDTTQQDEQDNKGDERRRDDNDWRRKGAHDSRGGEDNDAWRRNDANDNRGRDDNDWRRGRTNIDSNVGDRDRYNRDRVQDRRFDRRHDRRDYRDRRSPSFNINIYRRNIQSPRRYRHGTYRYPRGFNYRRWHYGQRLPVIFWRDRDYWLLDYIAFGLFAPPPGYVWVRYGPDALLIDTYTGEIVQVRYNVFYS